MATENKTNQEELNSTPSNQTDENVQERASDIALQKALEKFTQSGQQRKVIVPSVANGSPEIIPPTEFEINEKKVADEKASANKRLRLYHLQQQNLLKQAKKDEAQLVKMAEVAALPNLKIKEKNVNSSITEDTEKLRTSSLDDTEFDVHIKPIKTQQGIKFVWPHPFVIQIACALLLGIVGTLIIVLASLSFTSLLANALIAIGLLFQVLITSTVASQFSENKPDNKSEALETSPLKQFLHSNVFKLILAFILSVFSTSFLPYLGLSAVAILFYSLLTYAFTYIGISLALQKVAAIQSVTEETSVMTWKILFGISLGLTFLAGPTISMVLLPYLASTFIPIVLGGIFITIFSLLAISDKLRQDRKGNKQILLINIRYVAKPTPGNNANVGETKYSHVTNERFKAAITILLAIQKHNPPLEEMIKGLINKLADPKTGPSHFALVENIIHHNNAGSNLAKDTFNFTEENGKLHIESVDSNIEDQALLAPDHSKESGVFFITSNVIAV